MKRIIVKIGTHTLIDKNGAVDPIIIAKFAKEIKNLQKNNCEIIVVSSGAVAEGRFLHRGKNDLTKRVLASIGQAKLTAIYVEEFSKESLLIGQILLGKNDILDKITYNVLRETIDNLLQSGIIPLINENDALTNGTSSSYKDNDSLAVVVALATGASMVINLSHVDGMYDKDPEKYTDAQLISKVENITKELMRQCDTNLSKQGSGGMIAKLRAMRLASSFGITMVIANGRKENIIERTVAGKNEGTVFLANPKASLKNRDRWIVSAKISTGSIKIDAGAAEALKKGKSLLAVGVKKIYGVFESGEVIDVLDMAGDILAIGIVKISYYYLQELLNNKEKIYNQEVIHVDDLIIL